MSRPLASATSLPAPTRRVLRESWRQLQAVLEKEPFRSVDHCQRFLEQHASDFQPLGQHAFSLLAERMAELAQERTYPPNLWQLFADAVGIPQGSRRRRVQLSQPPLVTFGPNPWLARQLVNDTSATPPSSGDLDDSWPAPGPFAADVSEGKGHVIYNAHSYHTKVPHRAIMRYLLHYTQPGDVVFDGFCGTGMTGVAAALCGSRHEIEALGYRIAPDGRLVPRDRSTASPTGAETKAGPQEPPRLGRRRAFLMDLSPAATLIAATFNTPHDVAAFASQAQEILDQLDRQLGWMYWTLHAPPNTPSDCANDRSWTDHLARRIDKCDTCESLREVLEEAAREGASFGVAQTVGWSDVFACPACASEFAFAEAAVDANTGKVARDFPCPNCREDLQKRQLIPVRRSEPTLTEPAGSQMTVPTSIHYHWEGMRYRKQPDAVDRALLRKLGQLSLDDPFPSSRLFQGRETRRNDRRGITHVHHFYTPRNLRFLAAMKKQCDTSLPLLLWFSSQLVNLSKLNRYRPNVTFPYNPLSGTLYVGSQVAESHPLTAYRNKLPKITKALEAIDADNTVQCGSLSGCLLPDNSVDYIFTDPPFGGNLSYSELNVLWESWLGISTRRQEEAIETRGQGKSPEDYGRLMQWCFRQYYRVLKPGKWLTVEFHHTQPHVWKALQDALCRAGFIIADVRTLDKQLGTFKQVTNPGAVQRDLIVSAYKLNRASAVVAARPVNLDSVWNFIDERLTALPKSPRHGDYAERQDYRLFNRLVAWLLASNRQVPFSAPEFYAELRRRYRVRDGHFFLA